MGIVLDIMAIYAKNKKMKGVFATKNNGIETIAMQKNEETPKCDD